MRRNYCAAQTYSTTADNVPFSGASEVEMNRYPLILACLALFCLPVAIKATQCSIHENPRVPGRDCTLTVRSNNSDCRIELRIPSQSTDQPLVIPCAEVNTFIKGWETSGPITRSVVSFLRTPHRLLGLRRPSIHPITIAYEDCKKLILEVDNNTFVSLKKVLRDKTAASSCRGGG